MLPVVGLGVVVEMAGAVGEEVKSTGEEVIPAMSVTTVVMAMTVAGPLKPLDSRQASQATSPILPLAKPLRAALKGWMRMTLRETPPTTTP